LLATGGKAFLEPQSPVQYLGPHWYHIQGNRYATTFPPGLAVLLAAAFKLLGPTAALLVNPLLTSLTLLGLFLLCRPWAGEKWAWVALLLMATNPFFNEHALFGDSHTALDFFFVWSLVLLIGWSRTDSRWRAFLTGLCAGMMPTIRYPEVVLGLGMALWALLQLRARRISWHSLLLAGVGALVPLGALMVRNQALFGAFWKTGYGFMNEPNLFSWHYLAAHWASYLLRLLTEGGGPCFPLGVSGIAIMLTHRETRQAGILLVMLIVPATVLYMSYFFPPDPQSMRYLLPTLLIYPIASVWLLARVVPQRPPWKLLVPVLLVLVSGMWGLPRSIFALKHLQESNAVLARITRLIETHVERGSVLVAGDGVNQDLDFLGHWRLVDGRIASTIPPAALPAASAGLAPAPGQTLRNEEACAKFRGLTGQERFDLFAREVWRWAAGGHRVYLLGAPGQVNWFKAQISRQDDVVGVAELELPDWRARQLRGRVGPHPGQMAAQGQPQAPMGPGRIFDLKLDGDRLLLAEWERNVSHHPIGGSALPTIRLDSAP